MAKTTFLDVADKNPLQTIREFLKSILNTDDVQALLVPGRSGSSQSIMPVLINDPDLIDDADPLSPCFPVNSARLASKLSHKPIKGKIAMVLRPCEIRALIELSKLKQADLANTVIIGIDCLGAYSTKYWAQINATDADSLPGGLPDPGNPNDPHLAAACRACEHFVPENADILIGLFGINTTEKIMIQGITDAGMALLKNLPQEMVEETSEEPVAREKAVTDLLASRIEYRDTMFETTRQAIDSHEKFVRYFDRCINCYNCRVACPVCYCKECVFNTDVFDHDPYQYLQWARRKGAVKLPADTVFYHMTRLAHMSLSCVGCGQCSNVCPNDIPVMELFRLTAADVQHAFEYEAGRDKEEPLPLSVFKEDEFTDIVGIE